MRIVKLRNKIEQSVLLIACVNNMDTIEEIQSYRKYVAEHVSRAASGKATTIQKDFRSVDRFIEDIRAAHGVGNPKDPTIKVKIKQGKEHTIEVKNNVEYIIIQRN